MTFMGIDPDDLELRYCPSCDEEYQTMSGETECPICGKETEEA